MCPTLIDLGFEWIKQDGDTSVCMVCKEPIYGKMYVATVDVHGVQVETGKRKCEPCYEMSNGQ